MAEGARKGWRRVKFGDVVRLCTERVDPKAVGIERYVGLEHIDSDDLRVRRWGDVADGTTFTNRFKPGQVLFGKRRAYQRKVAVAEFEGVCSGDIYVLEPSSDALLPQLLPFICQSDGFFEHALKTSAGSLSPRTNWTSLKEYEFDLPPREEQHRTVDVLGELDSAIGATAAIQAAAAEVELSFCCQVLSSRGERHRVGDLAKFTSGAAIAVSDLPKESAEGCSIPVFGGNGISGYTQSGLEGVLDPTVVVGRVGQACGAVFLARGAVWVTDNALHPRWLSPDVSAAFLAICLRGARLNRNKLGEYLPLINQTTVHQIEIPVPELTDQHLFERRFDDIIRSADDARRRVKSLKRFRGELLREAIR